MKSYLNSINPFFDQLFGYKATDSKLMRTDIVEHENEFVISIELPDVNKEDVKISLKDGNLNVSVNKEDHIKDDENIILKERFVGTYSRSYYVGEEVKFNDISAKLDKGVLTLTIKKVKPEVKEETFINID